MADAARTTKDRSPNFPFISLATALQRAQDFHSAERRGAAPFAVAVGHWGMSPSSSGALQTVAALKQYGLMSDEGSGQSRKVRLTDLALRIILDTRPDSTEKPALMRQAARTPTVAAEVHKIWPDEFPSPPNLNHYLVVERKFNPDNARKAVRILQQNHELTGAFSITTENHISDQVDDAVGSDIMQAMNPSKTRPLEPAVRSFASDMPRSAVQGEEIANIRVSKICTVRLLASGPWEKRNIESLISQLQLGLKDGIFDDGSDESDSAS